MMLMWISLGIEPGYKDSGPCGHFSWHLLSELDVGWLSIFLLFF